MYISFPCLNNPYVYSSYLKGLLSLTIYLTPVEVGTFLSFLHSHSKSTIVRRDNSSEKKMATEEESMRNEYVLYCTFLKQHYWTSADK